MWKVKLREPEETEAEKKLKKLIPKRLFKGSLSNDVLKEALSLKEYEWYELVQEKQIDFGKKMLEIVNFMDGKRTAHDITMAVSAEYGVTDPEHVLKFISDLKKLKLIDFG
jgi:hypothetical protein